jgi:hypothetical protein
MKKLFTLVTAIFILGNIIAQPIGWSHSRVISVTENSGSNIGDYQLGITFDSQTLITAGEMNAAGTDLRFGTTCTTIDLNYWIESGINTPTTKVWVKLDTLFASSTSNIYMFYGNSSATTSSSINGTFFGPQSGTDSVQNTTLSGSADAQRGFRFAPTEDVLVTAFGKYEPTGIAKYITLFDFVSQTILRQEQVSGPVATYTYGNTPPIWLTQNTQYLLEIFSPAGNDAYYFGASPQMGQHMVYFDMRYCNGCTQNTFPTNILGGMHYGYVDFLYYTKRNVTPAPTYSIGGPFDVNLGVDSVYCGSIVLDAGNTGSTYAWSTTESTQTITVTSSGTYGLLITTPDNCVASDSVDIVINTNPTVDLGVDSAYCTGTILDAGAGFTYLWNDLSTSQTLDATGSGNYSVQITDGNMCSGFDTVVVTVYGLPTINGAATPNTVCTGDTVDFEGTGGISYIWDNGIVNGLNAVATGGNFIVTGTDANNCVNSDTVFVTVNTLPTVDFSFATDSVCISSGLVALSGGAPAGGTYTGTGVSGSNFDPATGVNNYVLTYTYTDGNGCVNSDTENLLVSPCLGIDEMVFGNVTIFPNPTTGLLNINVGKFSENMVINLFDMLGKVVLNTKLQNKESILQLNVMPGMYILEIRSGNQFLRKQVTVQ